MTVLSAFIGDAPIRLRQGMILIEVKPNLAVQVLAPAGEAKTEALKIAREMCQDNRGEDLVYFFPDDVTAEALIQDELKIHEEGVTAKDENSETLEGMQSKPYQAGLAEVYAQIKDGLPNPKKIGRKALNMPLTIGNVYVVFMCATTDGAYLTLVGSDGFIRGWAARDILLYGTNPNWVDWSDPDSDAQILAEARTLKNGLKSDLEVLLDNRPASFRYEPEALSYINRWASKWKEMKVKVYPTDPVYASVINKWCFIIIHKVCAIFEVSKRIKDIRNFKDREIPITKETAEKATSWLEETLSVAKVEILDKLQREDVLRLMSALVSIRKPTSVVHVPVEQSIQYSVLLRQSNLPSDRFKVALEDAIEKELLDYDRMTKIKRGSLNIWEGKAFPQSQWADPSIFGSVDWEKVMAGR
jgi:hypothetical protein